MFLEADVQKLRQQLVEMESQLYLANVSIETRQSLGEKCDHFQKSLKAKSNLALPADTFPGLLLDLQRENQFLQNAHNWLKIYQSLLDRELKALRHIEKSGLPGDTVKSLAKRRRFSPLLWFSLVGIAIAAWAIIIYIAMNLSENW